MTMFVAPHTKSHHSIIPHRVGKTQCGGRSGMYGACTSPILILPPLPRLVHGTCTAPGGGNLASVSFSRSALCSGVAPFVHIHLASRTNAWTLGPPCALLPVSGCIFISFHGLMHGLAVRLVLWCRTLLCMSILFHGFVRRGWCLCLLLSSLLRSLVLPFYLPSIFVRLFVNKGHWPYLLFLFQTFWFCVNIIFLNPSHVHSPWGICTTALLINCFASCCFFLFDFLNFRILCISSQPYF